MTKSEENTTSSVDSGSVSQQAGIPLKESEPLSHNPFVHVTLDAAERPSAAKESDSMSGELVPSWVRSRFFSHAPERPSRIARTFPKQEDKESEASPSGFAKPSVPIGRMPIPNPAAPLQPSMQRVSQKNSDRFGDKSSAPASSDPALRVVLEQKEEPSQVAEGVEGKVEIGSDHINLPNDIYAQDELNDLAANMPLIPRNLIFQKGMGAATSSSTTSRMPFPRVGVSQRRSLSTSPSTSGWRNGGYPSMGGQGMTGRMGNSLLQGNPRNGSSVPLSDPLAGIGAAGIGASGLQDTAYQDRGVTMAHPASLSPQQQASMGGHITPSVAAVPASTDYRSYARSSLGSPYNPLRPYSPTVFDASGGRVPDWRSQSEMLGGFGAGASGALAGSGYGSAALSGMSPSASQPLSGMQSPNPYDSHPLDSMRLGDSRNIGSSTGFPTTGVNRAEQTLPSGMPASFDSNPSRRMGAPSQSAAARIPEIPGSMYASGGMDSRSAFPSSHRAMNSAFPSNGDRGVPLDAGALISRNGFDKSVVSDSLKKREPEGASLFDQPPVPITEGMKSADTSHKKLRRVIIIVLLAVVLALGGIVGYLVYSGTVNPDELVPHITIEAPSGDSGFSGGSSNGSSASSSSSSASANVDTGSVVYQYTALTSDGTAYTVEETATFSEDGYCEFTTMKMKFPDAEKAKSFTDNLARDYGNSFTLDQLDGANATVTIDNSSLHLDREKYEESLRYSVEDLVILKK